MNLRLISCGILLAFSCVSSVHALYRGDEFEPRSYEVRPLFFVNRATYEPHPLIQDRFNQATNAYIGAAGSMTSDDLYLYQHLKMAHPLSDVLTLHAAYIQDRDFDGHFQHFPLALAYHWRSDWSIELVGEPTPDKEYADIGAALAFRKPTTFIRVQWLQPDFVFHDKNPDQAVMTRDAPNLQVALRHALSRGWMVFAHADVDPSRTLLNPAESFEFRFKKMQGQGGLRWTYSALGHVEGSVEGESTQKARDGLNPTDPKSFSENRDYVQWKLEFVRRLDEPDAYFRTGLLYILFDEEQAFPYAQDLSLITDQQDRIVYAGRSWPLRDHIQMNTLLLLDGLDVRHERQAPEEVIHARDLAVRLALSLLLTGDRYQLEAGAAINADQANFGGGFVKVFADF